MIRTSVRLFASKPLTPAKFIQRELMENPEFFKAYPHLQKAFDKDLDTIHNKEVTRKMQEGDSPNVLYEYHNDKQVKYVDNNAKAPFFESLLHKHNTYAKPLDSPEELLRDNEINFVQAPSSTVEGPFKYLSKERIQEIHLDIDQRMQELSESGLSRNEILFEDPKIGVPLMDDPFFQLVRTSRTVREMLIKPNEEFTADRVIEHALRQDVGPDASQSQNQQAFRILSIHKKLDLGQLKISRGQLGSSQNARGMNQKLNKFDENPNAPAWEYKKKYRNKDPLYDPEAQYAGYNVIGRSQRMFAYEMEKPATFLNRPLSRNQLRKRFMRSVDKKELDWKNTPLITKFLNDTGKLYNRYQSRLPTSVHRKVAHTVKKMRHLGLLPWVGILKPTDKIPIGSYIEDIEEMHRKTIDPVTGRLFLKYSLMDDMRERQKRVYDSYQRKYDGVEGAKEEDIKSRSKFDKAQDRVIREMGMDVDRMYPNRQQKEWLAAQAYIVKKQDLVDSNHEPEQEADALLVNRLEKEIVSKLAFENTNKAVIKTQAFKDPSCLGNSLMENLLRERAYDLDHFAEQTEKPPVKKMSVQEVSDSVQKEARVIIKQKRETKQKEEEKIRSDIDQLFAKYANPRDGRTETIGMAFEELEPEIADASTRKPKRVKTFKKKLSEPKH